MVLFSYIYVLMKKRMSGLQWYFEVKKMLSSYDCIVSTPKANRETINDIISFAKESTFTYMRVNTEYKKYGFYISRGNHGNAVILPREVMLRFCEEKGFDIKDFFEKNMIVNYSSKEFTSIRHLKNVRQERIKEQGKVRRRMKKYDIINSTTTSEKQKHDARLYLWSERKIENDEINTTEYEKSLFAKLYGVYRKRVKKQQRFIVNRRVYFADIYMKAYKAVIEVDGGYHNSPQQIEKDKQKDLDLSTLGLLVIRVKNEDVRKRFGLIRNILEKRHKDIIKGVKVSTGTMRI